MRESRVTIAFISITNFLILRGFRSRDNNNYFMVLHDGSLCAFAR